MELFDLHDATVGDESRRADLPTASKDSVRPGTEEDKPGIFKKKGAMLMRKTASVILSDVLDGRDLTFSDLVALTGLKPTTVTTGLYQLRCAGVLKTATIRQQSQRGRPRVIYSLEDA